MESDDWPTGSNRTDDARGAEARDAMLGGRASVVFGLWGFGLSSLDVPVGRALASTTLINVEDLSERGTTIIMCVSVARDRKTGKCKETWVMEMEGR